MLIHHQTKVHQLLLQGDDVVILGRDLRPETLHQVLLCFQLTMQRRNSLILCRKRRIEDARHIRNTSSRFCRLSRIIVSHKFTGSIQKILKRNILANDGMKLYHKVLVASFLYSSKATSERRLGHSHFISDILLQYAFIPL